MLCIQDDESRSLARMTDRLPKFLLCLVAGALLPLAFAPYKLFILALACPALLFYSWLDAPPRAAFFRGYAFGFGMFGTGVYWLHISINLFGGMSYAGSIAVTFLLVAFLSLYPGVAGLVSRYAYSGPRRDIQLLLAAPAVWVLAEWLRATLFTGFPWLDLGYSQIASPLGGLAPVMGVFGVSWATALCAGALVVVCVGKWRLRMLGLVVLALLPAAGWISGLHHWTRSTGGQISVALVQGDVPQSLKWHPELQQYAMHQYSRLTEPLWGSSIIVWPETAIPALYRNLHGFMQRLANRARQSGTDLYVGLPTSNAAGNRYFNSVVLVDGRGHRYNKRHLVPFGEYLPLRPWLQGMFDFLHIPMSDFSPGGPEQPLLHGRNATVGVSICYEDTFGEEVAQALPQAQILINVSDDAWFGDSAAPHQHLQMARMRALETGRYLLRATDNGISAVIDPHGRIVDEAPQFAAAVVKAPARLMKGATPYSVMGDKPVLIGTLFVFLLAAVTSRRLSGDAPD